MFNAQNFKLFKNRKKRKIAKLVRAGILPKGVSKEEIWEALTLTKPRNVMETMGFLSAIVHKPDGSLKKDYGLVSVKEVTSVFAKRLVDCMTTSGDAIEDFKFHKMGAGSTAEDSDQTALITGQDGAQTATGGAAVTHGATSEIYRTIGTLTAGSAYGCREHGVFNATTGGVMLDRSLVTNIDLNIDDVVTWTYELTVNAGG
jgi:hypothetical protein